MTLNKSIEEEVEEAEEVEMLEDVGWGAIGSEDAEELTVKDAREFLKLTAEDIAGIQQRYEKLLDKMLDDPCVYGLLERQQSLI